jgi:predicted cupin superfamily sugar epimerase
MLSASEVVRLLGLIPHPEGGHYRETFRDTATSGQGRAASTAIYFLLQAGEVSLWHRIDTAEVWHWYAGSPLQLQLRDSGGRVTTLRLGNDLAGGDRPQVVVPASVWQSARSAGEWTLVGCTVAPGFEFASFELAPGGDMPRS